MDNPVTTQRGNALAENFYSEGWYTQAHEIQRLVWQRDALLRECQQLRSMCRAYEQHAKLMEHKHAMAITPNVPEGFDTVLGYLAKHSPDVLDAMDYTDPNATKRDGFWLRHHATDYRVVDAPPVLRACGITHVNAWPVDDLKRRLG